ncbi:DsbA family protein [Streptomyces sp. NPDC056921]|uniref:DsbA family protein n=1 Tax=Streptomyces sp. NPDC056921 TaxID=3345966 RepID=UPI003624D962
MLTYAFDAYCPWCYGFGPALRAFTEDNAHRIRLGVLSAGRSTGARARPVAAYPHLSTERARTVRLTGVVFGAGYERALSQGTTVLDTAAAAAGPSAPRDQPGTSELDVAEAVQRAWFIDGRSLSDAAVHRDIADELGGDADAATAAYSPPASREKACAGFRALRRLRVTFYPALLLHPSHGADQRGVAASTAASLTAALDQRLTTTIPKPSTHGLTSQGDAPS